MSELERTKVVAFCIWVWWLHGWSAGRIARSAKLTERAVKGRIERRFKNTRDELGIEGRQGLLDELKAKREDDGRLPAEHFVAQPLTKVQLTKTTKRPPGAALAPNSEKPITRKEQRRRDKETERRRRHDSEFGRAPRLLAPFEHLIKTKLLADPLNAPGPDIATSGRRREEAGLKFRGYLAGQQISGLKSVNYEGMSGGGNLGLPMPAYRLHCIATVGQLRGLMTPSEFELLEAVIHRDEYVWDSIRVRVTGVDPNDDEAWKAARKKAIAIATDNLIEKVRAALDIVALYEGGLLSHQGFEARWSRTIPYFIKTSREGAGEVSRGAGELLKAGRRR